MIAVIFEVLPHSSQRQNYLDLAAQVMRDYALHEREQSPQDSQAYHHE